MDRNLHLTDYIISCLRNETGLWFDLADAREFSGRPVIINSATLLDGKTFARIMIAENTIEIDDTPLCRMKAIDQEVLFFIRFREDSRQPIDSHTVRGVIDDARGRYSSIVELSDTAALIPMELHGEQEAGLRRWAKEAAKRLGGIAEFMPQYDGKLREAANFQIDEVPGELWLQIRLREPCGLHAVEERLQLQGSSAMPIETCRRYTVSQEDRGIFGINRVALKYRRF